MRDKLDEMRTALVYIVLLAIMLPTVSPLGTIAYFNLNRDYIARVLCENRDRPELHCNGQCYLAKRLKAQQDKQNKETTERVQNLPVLQWFCVAMDSYQFEQPVTIHTASPLVACVAGNHTGYHAELLQPPNQLN